MDTIKIKYFSTRPYNRMYVGFAVTDSESVRILNGALSRSTHFDGQHEGKWYKAVARLVYEFMQERPQFTYEYADDRTVNLTADMDYETVAEKIKNAWIMTI